MRSSKENFLRWMQLPTHIIDDYLGRCVVIPSRLMESLSPNVQQSKWQVSPTKRYIVDWHFPYQQYLLITNVENYTISIPTMLSYFIKTKVEVWAMALIEHIIPCLIAMFIVVYCHTYCNG